MHALARLRGVGSTIILLGHADALPDPCKAHDLWLHRRTVQDNLWSMDCVCICVNHQFAAHTTCVSHLAWGISTLTLNQNNSQSMQAVHISVNNVEGSSTKIDLLKLISWAYQVTCLFNWTNDSQQSRAQSTPNQVRLRLQHLCTRSCNL